MERDFDFGAWCQESLPVVAFGLFGSREERKDAVRILSPLFQETSAPAQFLVDSPELDRLLALYGAKLKVTEDHYAQLARHWLATVGGVYGDCVSIMEKTRHSDAALSECGRRMSSAVPLFWDKQILPRISRERVGRAVADEVAHMQKLNAMHGMELLRLVRARPVSLPSTDCPEALSIQEAISRELQAIEPHVATCLQDHFRAHDAQLVAEQLGRIRADCAATWHAGLERDAFT